MITILFNKEEKLYIQIYEYIVKEIKNKNIKPNEKLPSRRNLAEHLGVSINTVKSAYEQLLDEGYIVSRERSGYYVDKLISEDLPDLNPTKIVHEKPKEKKYLYNFKYSLIDKKNLPITILKKCSEDAIEKAVNNIDDSVQGLWELREEISKYLRERKGVEQSEKNIVITTSFYENLYLINKIIKKSKFAMEDPGYIRIEKMIENLDKKIIKIPIDKYGFSVRDLEKTDANIAIITPNYQFPTGIITGIRRRQRLYSWAKEKSDRYIIEDDYNSDFKYQGKQIPALKAMDKNGKVIHSGSFSQSIGKFLSVSYLVLSDEFIEKIKDIKMERVSLLQQYTLYNFLKSGDFEKHINRMNTHYRKKRKKVVKILQEKEGIEILSQDAGLHIVIRMDEKIYDIENFEKITEKNNIYIEKLNKYATRKWQDNEIILGFGGIIEEEIEDSINFLIKILKK